MGKRLSKFSSVLSTDRFVRGAMSDTKYLLTIRIRTPNSRGIQFETTVKFKFSRKNIRRGLWSEKLFRHSNFPTDRTRKLSWSLPDPEERRRVPPIRKSPTSPRINLLRKKKRVHYVIIPADSVKSSICCQLDCPDFRS